jgi:exosortase D (VPLPA-CTERM-specific)
MSTRRWTTIALLAVAIGLLFWDVLAKLVNDWSHDENYSHGFLVIPLIGYVLWRERERLAGLRLRPSMFGLAVVIASVLTLIAGRIGAELFLTRLALLGVLAGSILYVWGRNHLRALGFPFLLLALAIPIPAIIFNQITFPLQLLASRFGEFTISACQIPVLREGNVITLATTSLEVVEACSGIRSLVSLLTLAVVWAYLTQSPMWLRIVLALSSIPIAIFANGIRVAGTGVAAHFIGPRAAEGFLHTFSGWMVFVVAGLLMLGVHRLGVWLAPDRRLGQSAPAPGTEEPAPSEGDPRRPAGTLRRSVVTAAVLVVAAFASGALTRTEASGLPRPLNTLPLSIGRWRGEDLPAFDAKLLETLAVDEYVNRVYSAPGEPWVSLYVGYYRSQRQGQTVHSPLNCMPGAGWQPTGRAYVSVARPAAGGQGTAPVQINRLVIQKGLDRQLVLYWYQAHGRIVASEYWGKIYTVVDAVRLNRSDASLVRVIVPISSLDPGAEQAAERAGMEFVDALLSALSAYLGG